MKNEKLLQNLRRAIAKGRQFGPEDPGATKIKVDAKTLRKAILAEPGWRSKGLLMRNAEVVGSLDFEGCKVGTRLRFTNCRFERAVNVSQASLPDLSMVACELLDGINAFGVKVTSNLRLDGSQIRGVALVGASVGGYVSMMEARLAAPQSGSTVRYPLQASGIEVGERFDCEGATILGPVAMVSSQIGGLLDFSKAVLKNPGESAGNPIFSADGASIDGPVFMTELEADGEVRMLGARVAGQFSLDRATINGELALLGVRVDAEFSLNGATLRNANGAALLADRLTVQGGVFCSDEFRAEGQVRLPGAKIRSQLSMLGATINGGLNITGAAIEASLTLSQTTIVNSDGDALLADRAVVKDSIYAMELQVEGRVRIAGAAIGRLVLLKSRLSNAGRTALVAQALTSDAEIVLTPDCVVDGDLNFTVAKIGAGLELRGMRLTGELNLQGASVGEDIALNGAKIVNDAGTCISAERLKVDGTVFIRDGFESGEIRLGSASLGGLYIQDSSLNGSKAATRALHADSAQIAGSLFCERTDMSGEARLPGAVIGSQLSLRESKLHNEGGTALSADRLRVGHGAYLDGMSASGEVNFTNATVDGQFSVIGAAFAHSGGNALDLSSAHVGELMLSVRSVQGKVDLRRASVTSLWDAEDGKPLWPAPEELRLEGLTYRVLREPLTYQQRLEWIEPSQADNYYPGVYRELADNYRRIGRSSDARAIAIAAERRARNQLARWSARRAWSDLLYVTIGYGYRNWLALIWLVALISVGALAFNFGEDKFVETAVDTPPFNPLLYSVDATVPVLEVGQQRAWGATGTMAWITMALAISGYVLATAVIAAAAGLLSRDQNSEA